MVLAGTPEVKTHISSLYSELAVGSEALALAREMHLLGVARSPTASSDRTEFAFA